MQIVTLASYRRILPLLFWLPAALSAQQTSLTLTEVWLRIDPQGSDAYSLKGSFNGLNLDQPQKVTLKLGAFQSAIPMDQFADLGGGVLKYEDTSGTAPFWISSLQIDRNAGTFEATAAGIALAGLPNPFSVRLEAGDTSACAVTRVQRQQDGSYTPAPGERLSSPCLVDTPPVMIPVLAGTRTDLAVSVRILPSPGLQTQSILLYRVDSDARTVGNPLCRLTSQSGNDYGCTLTVNENSAQTIPLMIQATDGVATMLSPGFRLQISRPGVDADVEQFTAVEEAFGRLRPAFDELGDSAPARIRTLLALRAQFGGADAGLTTQPVALSPDSLSIQVRLDCGFIVSMVLNRLADAGSAPPPASAFASSPASAGSPASRPPASPSSLFETGLFDVAGQRIRTQLMPNEPPACGEPKRDVVPNSKVMIWSLLRLWFNDTRTGTFREIFDQSKCPKFTVETVEDFAATPASVPNWSGFGTLIIETHGGVTNDGRGFFLTAVADKGLALSDPANYSSGCVDYYPPPSRQKRHGCFLAIPTGSRFLPRLNRAMIFGGFCFSNSMFPAFVPSNSGNAYFGYTPSTNTGTSTGDIRRNFDMMVRFYAASGDNSGDGVAYASVSGNRKLAYTGNPELTSPSKGNSTTYSVDPGGTIDLEAKLEGTEQCEGVMPMKWKSTAAAGRLVSASDSSKRDDYTHTDFKANYTGNASPVTPLDTITVDFRPNAASSEDAEPIAARACTSVGVGRRGLTVTTTGVFTWGDSGPLQLNNLMPPHEVTFSTPYQISHSALGGTSSLNIEQTSQTSWKITQRVNGAATSNGSEVPTTWNRVDIALTNGPGSRQIKVRTEAAVSGSCQGLDVRLVGPLTWSKRLDSGNGCRETFEVRGFSVGPQGRANLFLNLAIIGGPGARFGPGSGTITTTVDLLESTDPFLP